MSFVIREKATGRVVCELQGDYAAKLKPEFESVPILQHLVELNDPASLARKYAERAV